MDSGWQRLHHLLDMAFRVTLSITYRQKTRENLNNRENFFYIIPPEFLWAKCGHEALSIFMEAWGMEVTCMPKKKVKGFWNSKQLPTDQNWPLG